MALTDSDRRIVEASLVGVGKASVPRLREIHEQALTRRPRTVRSRDMRRYALELLDEIETGLR